MKPPKRPDVIEIGPFKVHLKLVSHDLAYEVGEQQGSFHAKPPITIVLDENIMLLENENTFNLLVHELFHCCYYQYNLDKANEEENVVNAYANFVTELFTRSNAKDYLVYLTRDKLN